MTAYGQFCSIAKALEVFGDKWTPLIVRELVCGSSRFSEIHRGVPRISPTLLSRRLAALVEAGVVHRKSGNDGYELTEAGAELQPILELLGVWGQRWVRGQLSDADFDPDLLMWDMRRRIDFGVFDTLRICIRFEYTDTKPGKSLYWLVGTTAATELCTSDPGFEVDLYVTTDIRTMIQVWNGDQTLSRAISTGAIDLHGAQEMRKKFKDALLLNLFAGVAEATSISNPRNL